MDSKISRLLPIVMCLNLTTVVHAETTALQGKSYMTEERKYPQDSASTPEDEQLNKKIRDNVSNGWIWDNYKDVSIHTNHGDVTIEGVVPEMKDQEKIISKIERVPGVKSVKATLRLQYSGDSHAPSKEEHKYSQDTFTNPSDEQLNKKIRDNVSTGWFWNHYKDISIHTNNGDVTIEGSVKEMKEQQKLLNEIQKIHGVKSVTSHLHIQRNKPS